MRPDTCDTRVWEPLYMSATCYDVRSVNNAGVEYVIVAHVRNDREYIICIRMRMRGGTFTAFQRKVKLYGRCASWSTARDGLSAVRRAALARTPETVQQ